MDQAREGAAPTSTKVTVKLNHRTMKALEKASKQGGLNKTDTINRAVQVYAHLLGLAGDDGAITVVVNGQPERFHF